MFLDLERGSFCSSIWGGVGYPTRQFSVNADSKGVTDATIANADSKGVRGGEVRGLTFEVIGEEAELTQSAQRAEERHSAGRRGWGREFTTYDKHSLAISSSPFLVLIF